MDELQAEASGPEDGLDPEDRPEERDIAAERAADPKPVYDGDWMSATGVQKGRHSERVRQWRRREEERAEVERQRRMAAGLGQPVSPLRPDAAAPGLSPSGLTDADAASRAVLVAIRDNPNAHDSDRIRAVQQLAALDRGAEQQGDTESPLVALRAVLETLQPHERLAWLQGERLEASGGAA